MGLVNSENTSEGSLPPPGWYSNPDGAGERWWNGQNWATEFEKPAAQPGPAARPQSALGPLEPEQERTQSMWCHLAPLLVVVPGSLVTCGVSSLFGWVYPLIVMMSRGDRSRTLRENAVESLNFQLTLLIVGLGSSLVFLMLTVVTLGLAWLLYLPLVVAYLVYAGVLTGTAASKANRGEMYRYPLTWRMVN